MNNKEICINKIFNSCNSKIKEYKSLQNVSIVPERKIELQAKAQFANKLLNLIENITNKSSIENNKSGNINQELKEELFEELIKKFEKELEDKLLKKIKKDIYDYLNMDIDIDDE